MRDGFGSLDAGDTDARAWVGFAGNPMGVTIPTPLYAETIVKQKPNRDEEVRFLIRDGSGALRFEIGSDGRLHSLAEDHDSEAGEPAWLLPVPDPMRLPESFEARFETFVQNGLIAAYHAAEVQLLALGYKTRLAGFLHGDDGRIVDRRAVFAIGGRLQNLHGVRLEILQDGKVIRKGLHEPEGGWVLVPVVPPTSSPSATEPEFRRSNAVASRASGLAGLSPEHLRIGRDTLKREADRIQFQVLANRRDSWKQQNPALTAEGLQALLDRDPDYQQLQTEKECLRQLQAAIESWLDQPAAVTSDDPHTEDNPHTEARPRRKSPWSERVRSNVWLLAIGGGVMVGVLGGSVVGPAFLDRASRSVPSLPRDYVNPREQVVERREFRAVWLPQALYDLNRQGPPDSEIRPSSPETLQEYLREQELAQSETAMIVNSVMLEGEDRIEFIRKNIYEECELRTPFAKVILEVINGTAPSSTFVGVLSSNAADDLEKLQLPPQAKAQFAQELPKLVQ
jgi:hypothetical protein